jgi:hypothetical protein
MELDFQSPEAAAEAVEGRRPWLVVTGCRINSKHSLTMSMAPVATAPIPGGQLEFGIPCHTPVAGIRRSGCRNDATSTTLTPRTSAWCKQLPSSKGDEGGARKLKTENMYRNVSDVEE